MNQEPAPDRRTRTGGTAMTDASHQEFDRLVAALYAAAFERSWETFRPWALECFAQWCGADGAAWLTHTSGSLPGEYAQWPESLAIDTQALRAVSLDGAQRERELRPLPAELGGDGRARGLGLAVAHRGTALQSRLLLRFPGEMRPDSLMLRRAAGHLVQAGTLALSQFVQRDEWLQALGRPSRGSSALVDAALSVYVASERFRRLVGEHWGEREFSSLPFTVPAALLQEGAGEFSSGDLHFRLARVGGLFLLHARRPHPLDGLSPREQDIARALAQGKTFKSVAREYDIAISTVANHASRIYRKLGLYRREDLVGLLRSAAVARAA